MGTNLTQAENSQAGEPAQSARYVRVEQPLTVPTRQTRGYHDFFREEYGIHRHLTTRAKSNATVASKQTPWCNKCSAAVHSRVLSEHLNEARCKLGRDPSVIALEDSEFPPIGGARVCFMMVNDASPGRGCSHRRRP